MIRTDDEIMTTWDTGSYLATQRLYFSTVESLQEKRSVGIEYTVVNHSPITQDIELRLSMPIILEPDFGTFYVGGSEPMLKEHEWIGAQVPVTWTVTSGNEGMTAVGQLFNDHALID